MDKGKQREEKLSFIFLVYFISYFASHSAVTIRNMGVQSGEIIEKNTIIVLDDLVDLFNYIFYPKHYITVHFHRLHFMYYSFYKSPHCVKPHSSQQLDAIFT